MCKADHGLRVILASLQSCYLDHARQALVLRAIVTQCYLASLNPSVHAVWLVTNNDKPCKIRINTTHACTHMGGRGCACALAFLLYYLHPPRNFFCTNVPILGSVCAHGYARVDTPMFDASIPPRPPHSMASFPRVCVCSLKDIQQTPPQCQKVMYLEVYRFYILHE